LSNREKLDILLESGAQETIDAGADVRWLSTEQSNSSVIVGGRLVMKLMRRLQPGTHPEAEMCRFLTHVGYSNASPLLAEIVQRDPDDSPRSMLILEGFLSNEGDAWTYAIECLGNALTGHGGPASTEFQRLTGHVGRRLGELHTALTKGDGGAPSLLKPQKPATSTNGKTRQSGNWNRLSTCSLGNAMRHRLRRIRLSVVS
jgi:trehalose synthase-fused probable maltokinase